MRLAEEHFTDGIRQQPAGSRELLKLSILIGMFVLLTHMRALRESTFGWDAYTFILIGNELAHGHLPYLTQFDNKPPGVFIMIGAVIAVFGKSLFAIRAAAVFLIAVSCICTYVLARTFTGRTAALGGALCAALLGSTEIGQDFLAETPCALFMALALLLLARRGGMREAFMAGLLMGCTTLTRTNLAIPMLAIGLLLLIVPRYQSDFAPRFAWVAYGLGGCIPLALLIATYAAAGGEALRDLYLGLIAVPWAYSTEGVLPDSVFMLARSYARLINLDPVLAAPPAIMAPLGLWRSWSELDRTDPHTRGSIGVLWCAGLSILISMIFSGGGYDHYRLQLLPLVGVFSAFGFAWLLSQPSFERPARIGAAAIALLAVALDTPSAWHLMRHPSDYAKGGKMRAAAMQILKTAGPEPDIWALNYHLVSWYAGSQPVSPIAAQPDNLVRGYMTRTLEQEGYVSPGQLREVVSRRPEFIVDSDDHWGVDWVREHFPGVDAWLQTNYVVFGRFDDLVVYRRKTV